MVRAGLILVATAVVVAAAFFVLQSGLFDASSSDEQRQLKVHVSPTAVLFSDGEGSHALQVTVTDEDGNSVDVADVDIRWQVSDSRLATVTRDSDASGTATVHGTGETGTVILTAYVEGQPNSVSPLVTITNAKLKPGIELVADENVVFPPLDANETTGGVDFGGFSEQQIADLLDITDEFDVLYPVVVRNYVPEVGQHLLASEAAPIAGTVVSVQQKGEFTLVQLRVASPLDLFEELEFDVSAEELIESGQLLPYDTSAWEAPVENPVVAAQVDTPSKLARPLDQLIPPIEIGIFRCTLTGGPTFTQYPTGSNTYFGPIWDGNIRITTSGVENFYFKAGIQASAEFNPEIRFSTGGEVRVSCVTHPDFRPDYTIPVSGPIALVLAPYLEGLFSIPITVAMNGGNTTRYGMKMGFDYAVWNGFTWTPEDGFVTLCETLEECSRTNANAELIWEEDTSGDQLTLEGNAGLMLAAEGGIQAGGLVLGYIDRIPGLGTLLSGRISALKQFGRVPVLRVSYGPRADFKWHNADRTAVIERNESSAHALLAGDVTLRFDSLHRYLKTFLLWRDVYSLPVYSLPEVELFDPYRTLAEETIVVNGEKVTQSILGSSIRVDPGDTVEIDATVARAPRNISLLEIYLPRATPHTEFPYTAEAWINGKPFTTLAVTNDSEISGSFTVTPEMCEVAERDSGRVIEVKLLAYNYMFGVKSTANYVGRFSLGCTENAAPLVDAGPDRQIAFSEFASLDGSASDDDRPNGPNSLTFQWSKVSGPGTASFSEADRARTGATFSDVGTYVLQLTASDGDRASTDTVTVTVTEDPTPVPQTVAPSTSPTAGPETTPTADAAAPVAVWKLVATVINPDDVELVTESVVELRPQQTIDRPVVDTYTTITATEESVTFEVRQVQKSPITGEVYGEQTSTTRVTFTSPPVEFFEYSPQQQDIIDFIDLAAMFTLTQSGDTDRTIPASRWFRIGPTHNTSILSKVVVTDEENPSDSKTFTVNPILLNNNGQFSIWGAPTNCDDCALIRWDYEREELP